MNENEQEFSISPGNIVIYFIFKCLNQHLMFFYVKGAHELKGLEKVVATFPTFSNLPKKVSNLFIIEFVQCLFDSSHI